MADAGDRRCASATVVAADQDHIGAALGHTGGNRANADFRDQLDVDPGVFVGVLEVVDQFSEVFDRIDVVMWRRRDQADTRSGVARSCNPGVDLLARQLATFAGLGTLGHFDLDFAGVDQVFTCHAETAGSDLLDRGVF